MTRAAFVGREPELAQLGQMLESSVKGSGRLVLVSGEPGIGKSRLAEELATEAESQGATVAWGRCWEAGGAPAYWPWIQALRSLVAGLPPDRLRANLGPEGAELARLLPEVATALPDSSPTAEVDPETDRFRLFDAATSFLKRSAMDRPIVLILDDLHAADASSLLFLRFVTDAVEGAHLFVVACYRDTELGQDHPLAMTVSDLARRSVTLRMSLAGLGQDDVSAFLAEVSGRKPPADLAAAIHVETAGNPLFVEEVAQLFVSEGRLDQPVATLAGQLSVPQGIREVITRRVARLSDETNRLLSLASILGREFEIEALRELSGLTRDRLLDTLDESTAARIVEVVPGALGHLRFSHMLVRDTLYDEIPISERVRLHRKIGEALEKRYEHDLEPHLAELAHHFSHAAVAGEVDKAIMFSRRAAERAVGQLAYEEAARLFRLALQAVELQPSPDSRVRCELYLGLGDARARAGELESAKATFLRAAEIARIEGLPEHLGRAAIGYGGRFVWDPGRGDPHLLRLLEQALVALPETDSELRVRVMSRLAGGPLGDVPEAEARRATLSREAVEMARRLDDPASLAYALDARWVAIWGPDTLEERTEIAAGVVENGKRAHDEERTHDGHIWCALAALERGEISMVHSELELQAGLAAELRQPAQRWFGVVLRGTLATFEGRFAEAEELIPRGFALARAAGLLADLYGTLQLWALRREQGRLVEIEQALAELVGRFPMYPVLRCVRTHVAAELGRKRTARTELRSLAADTFSTLPRNDDWLFGLCLLADVGWQLDDDHNAGLIYELLLPYAERNAFNPPAACVGSVSRSLGVAAATLARWGDAERHLQKAYRANSEMGARPWVARTNHEWAEVLLRRDEPGDRERATKLAEEAAQIARDLDMSVVSTRSAALAQDDVRSGGVRPSVFRREGEYWTIAYRADTFRLKDSKGLHYLAQLLANPGRELHALDLVVGERTYENAADRIESVVVTTGSDDAGPILDARAKAEYRRRLTELEEDAEEARALGDTDRAAQANQERDFLVAELARAVGLGGRDRRASSASERARVSVTRAIRAALGKIHEHGPALGKHLERTIRTGTYCSYMPDPNALLDWDL